MRRAAWLTGLFGLWMDAESLRPYKFVGVKTGKSSSIEREEDNGDEDVVWIDHSLQ